jgi:hypothetical protein
MQKRCQLYLQAKRRCYSPHHYCQKTWLSRSLNSKSRSARAIWPNMGGCAWKASNQAGAKAETSADGRIAATSQSDGTGLGRQVEIALVISLALRDIGGAWKAVGCSPHQQAYGRPTQQLPDKFKHDRRTLSGSLLFISLPLFTLMIQQGKLSSISVPVFTTMPKETLTPEIRSLIQSRLRLAQDLLEESDTMPGHSGYCELNGDRDYHPRHEREALVNYLLLTCIDKLDQNNQGFISLADWLQSKKVEHVSKRQLILDSQAHDSPSDAKLRCLCKGDHRLYGVRNTFFLRVSIH